MHFYVYFSYSTTDIKLCDHLLQYSTTKRVVDQTKMATIDPTIVYLVHDKFGQLEQNENFVRRKNSILAIDFFLSCPPIFIQIGW